MNGGGEQDSVIKKVEKRLYSNKPLEPGRKVSHLSPKDYDVSGVWGDSEDISMIKKRKDIQGPILKTLLFFSLIFFLSAIGISLYFFFFGGNIVSSENIDLLISGPVSVRGGDDFDLQVVINNKNNVPLLFAELVIEYPPGAGSVIEGGKSINRFVKELNKIEPNGVIMENVRSVLFGEENVDKEVKVTLEYRTEGSNAIFVKEKTYKTFISSSPLSVALDLPADTSSGKDISLDIKVDSNSTETIKDVLLEISYPPGFIFKGARPAPSFGSNIWEFGDIPARGTRSISVSGSLQGQDGEVKTFRVGAGTRSDKNSNRVNILYGSSLKSLVVKRPFIGLTLVMNGDGQNADYVARGNDTISADVRWINNLPVKILNAELLVKINGDVLSKNSVVAGGGFFKSSENTITWDRLNGDFPQTIEPGEGGGRSFSFSFLPLGYVERRNFENPEINLEVIFRGTRFSEIGSSDSSVENILNRKIKLKSDLQLAPRVVYYVGPFKNSGSLPPERDKETTYTIIWSATNSSNNLTGVVAKASLPSYVKWMGNVSPSSENVTYSSLGREIVWNIGDMPSGDGINSKAREVAFQVSFTPSVSQVGEYPTLISDALITGQDEFTGTETRGSARFLSIQPNTDSLLKPGDNDPVR